MTLLSKESIALNIEVNSPEEAISVSGDLLMKAGVIRKEYIDAMVDGFKKVGPYIVVAPGIAIPHARPEYGALESGFSIVRLRTPIKFGHKMNDPVQLVCAMASNDNNGHIEMLRMLSSILGDSSKLAKILTAKDISEVYQNISN